MSSSSNNNNKLNSIPIENIVIAIFGKEAAQDEDILNLYRGAFYELHVALIQFVAAECANGVSEEDARSILYDFNKELEI